MVFHQFCVPFIDFSMVSIDLSIIFELCQCIFPWFSAIISSRIQCVGTARLSWIPSSALPSMASVAPWTRRLQHEREDFTMKHGRSTIKVIGLTWLLHLQFQTVWKASMLNMSKLELNNNNLLVSVLPWSLWAVIFFCYSFVPSFLPSFLQSFVPSILPSFLQSSFFIHSLHSLHSLIPSIPSFLPSFVPSILRSFNPSFIPSVLFFDSFPSFPHSFLHSLIPSFLRSFLPSFLPSFVPSFLRSFLPSFLPSFLHWPSFLPSFLPAFLPSFLPSFLCPGIFFLC